MKIKELMVPVSEYVTTGLEGSLIDVLAALKADRDAKDDKLKAHRDTLVIDDEGDVIGKITMIDIIKSLEPGYKRLDNGVEKEGTLSSALVAKLFKQYDLWGNALVDLCKKAADNDISNLMHKPHEDEFVNEDDDLEIALHRYIFGAHQPLLVQKDGKVTGILRLNDVFDLIKNRVLECKI